MNKVFAIASVVIKELIRRKDFYVLFVMTALITLILGSVNLFNDNEIVRYLKEICLLLIWISSFVIGPVPSPQTSASLPSRRQPPRRSRRAGRSHIDIDMI